MNKHPSALSASRIKTLQQCSWKYWCNYKLKLPDKSNDGASRGWICHLIFELLGEARHKKHYETIIKNGANIIDLYDVTKKIKIYNKITHNKKRLSFLIIAIANKSGRIIVCIFENK